MFIQTLLLMAFLAADWRSAFDVSKRDLGPTGRNGYFILEPGYKLHFKGGKTSMIMTVLNETKMIDGVETRVVEDREWENGKLAEVTRDYYAIDRKTGDVYYFGEDVDVYKNGKVASHKGSWLSGIKGAQFGLYMPAKPVVGDRFQQEVAPRNKAVDRSEVIAIGETVKTPAGTFEKCVHMKDSSRLEPTADHKFYAPGVGLLKDAELELVKIERN